jgi:hypothetical protein
MRGHYLALFCPLKDILYLGHQDQVSVEQIDATGALEQV